MGNEKAQMRQGGRPKSGCTKKYLGGGLEGRREVGGCGSRKQAGADRVSLAHACVHVRATHFSLPCFKLLAAALPAGAERQAQARRPPNGKRKHGTRPSCHVRVRGSFWNMTDLLRCERERCER